MPGQKSFIGNRRPGFYSDKYSIPINQINLDTEAPVWILVTIVVRLAI